MTQTNTGTETETNRQRETKRERQRETERDRERGRAREEIIGRRRDRAHTCFFLLCKSPSGGVRRVNLPPVIIKETFPPIKIGADKKIEKSGSSDFRSEEDREEGEEKGIVGTTTTMPIQLLRYRLHHMYRITLYNIPLHLYDSTADKVDGRVFKETC